MKHFSISRIGRLPAASLLFGLFTAFSACGDNSKSEPDLTKDIVGNYIGTLTVANTFIGDITQTPNVTLTIEKLDGKTVIVRPQLPGATAFRALVSTQGTQLIKLSWTDSETAEHIVTGPLSSSFQVDSKALVYTGSVTVNSQSQTRSESFQGNKK
jgi:hypothetical protein